MSKVLLIGLLLVFVGHFIAEVFVENKRLQRQINNLSFIGLILFFIVTVLVAIFIGI